MSNLDFLFSGTGDAQGTTFSGYGGQPFLGRDEAIMSHLPEGGSTTFCGINGSPRRIYTEGKRLGWSPSRLRELVEKHGR